MKRIGGLFIGLLTLTLMSCNNDVEDRLPGTWDAEVTRTMTNDSLLLLYGTMTFEEDGSGHTLIDGFYEPMTWESNKDNDLILDGESFYSNELNEEDKQVFLEIDPIGGASHAAKVTLTR